MPCFAKRSCHLRRSRSYEKSSARIRSHSARPWSVDDIAPRDAGDEVQVHIRAEGLAGGVDVEDAAPCLAVRQADGDGAVEAPRPDQGGIEGLERDEADEAAKKANQARLAAVAASQEAARTMMPVRVAENLKLRAEQQLAAAEAALLSAISAEARAEAEDTKTKALDRIAELRAQWAAAKADLQPKLDAVAPARAAAAAAEAVRVTAAQAAQEAARELEPVSVFISRKTQRLYVRRAFAPIWESPVTILQADRPMGTHVFTAMERTNDDSGMRWSVVTLDEGRPRAEVVEPQGQTRGGRGQTVEQTVTDPASARIALDRILIPQDALDRIAGMVSPRSSLIVSDEELSTETGKDTNFVVVLSGEPQGGIKSRRRGSGI